MTKMGPQRTLYYLQCLQGKPDGQGTNEIRWYLSLFVFCFVVVQQEHFGNDQMGHHWIDIDPL